MGHTLHLNIQCITFLIYQYYVAVLLEKFFINTMLFSESDAIFRNVINISTARPSALVYII